MALREIKYKTISYSLNYEIINNNKEKTILFLHGWGSNKEIMKQAFVSNLDRFKLIFLDLPGFGGSTIVEPLKTSDYKDIVEKFLESLNIDRYIIVGHSFGGKIGALLNPENLVLLSSAGILVDKSLKVKIKIKFFKMFKNIVPKSMYSLFASDDVNGMSQVMYETLKNVVDEDFLPVFKNVTAKSLIFWGEQDCATPLESGEKIHKTIKNSQFFPLKGDHFFFIKNNQFITKVLNEQL